MADPYRRQRLLEASGRLNIRGRRRGPERSPEETRLEQLSRSLGRALDQLQPNLDPAMRQQLITRGQMLNAATIKGKNIELLAAALLLHTTPLTPATYPAQIQEIAPTANNTVFNDEVLLYLLFLTQTQPGNQVLAGAPNWVNTWLPAELADAPESLG